MHDVEPVPENERLLEQDEPNAEESGDAMEMRPLGLPSEDQESVAKLLQDGELDDPMDDTFSKNELIWTPEKERRLVRKLDRLVMPLLIIAFFALQLDRGMDSVSEEATAVIDLSTGNIGNALTDFFLRDVAITQGQFNTGQQLIALGIVLWEIPSNFVRFLPKTCNTLKCADNILRFSTESALLFGSVFK